jgi:hypothetical protein
VPNTDPDTIVVAAGALITAVALLEIYPQLKPKRE